ncbi:unnamed protein product [Gongylonema pulchrum]|uniref:Uncharacterized protein n=1 Tax=Gongylonema pulchrum TaxID=637853 RepID=A0A183DNZ1_9BILA|nr:unnamed protein product [Gongylonema pulchrum]
MASRKRIASPITASSSSASSSDSEGPKATSGSAKKAERNGDNSVTGSASPEKDPSISNLLKLLQAGHQFVIRNVLYNRDYGYIDATFRFIQRHTSITREQVQCLSAHKRGMRKRRKHWLIYWTVFSFFTLQDYYTECLTRLFPPLLLLKAQGSFFPNF